MIINLTLYLTMYRIIDIAGPDNIAKAAGTVILQSEMYFVKSQAAT